MYITAAYPDRLEQDIEEKVKMSDFTELNSKEMNETNGGLTTIIVPVLLALGAVIYKACQ